MLCYFPGDQFLNEYHYSIVLVKTTLNETHNVMSL